MRDQKDKDSTESPSISSQGLEEGVKGLEEGIRGLGEGVKGLGDSAQVLESEKGSGDVSKSTLGEKGEVFGPKAWIGLNWEVRWVSIWNEGNGRRKAKEEKDESDSRETNVIPSFSGRGTFKCLIASYLVQHAGKDFTSLRNFPKISKRWSEHPKSRMRSTIDVHGPAEYSWIHHEKSVCSKGICSPKRCKTKTAPKCRGKEALHPLEWEFSGQGLSRVLHR